MPQKKAKKPRCEAVEHCCLWCPVWSALRKQHPPGRARREWLELITPGRPPDLAGVHAKGWG